MRQLATMLTSSAPMDKLCPEMASTGETGQAGSTVLMVLLSVASKLKVRFVFNNFIQAHQEGLRPQMLRLQYFS